MMARRKKPEIKGADPRYTHSLDRYRPVSTDMPPDVIIPGLDEKQAADTVGDATKNASQSPPEKPKRPQSDHNPDPKKSRTEQTSPLEKKPTTKTANSRSKPPLATNASEPPKATPPERQTTLDAAVTTAQADRMQPLVEKGLRMRDIVVKAGRAATKGFELKNEFVPKAVADRMPMKDGYHTSKRLPVAILERLRAEHDPLEISSDSAMVRGQFEARFWTELDKLIDELLTKYT